jgi:OFA family oxalate/formate antiporter-like MFS transporter
VLLGLGYTVSWLGGSNFVLLWLSSGLITGLAVGAGYVCPIATAVKWFPDRKGLVSGLAVLGYGASAILVTTVAEALLDRGWNVLDIFGAVGAIFGPVVLLGLLLFLPGPIEPSAAKTFRRRDLAGDGRFWWMFLAFFTATVPALIFIGNLKKIAGFLGNTSVIASGAVVAMAIGNSAGRVVWGFVYDRLGGRRSALLSIASNALIPAALLTLGGTAGGLLAVSFLAGFCYGGCFGIYAPETARIYGASVMGSAYPFVLLAHGIAAVAGPPIVGCIFDLTKSYTPGLLGGAAIAMIGLCVCAAWRRGAGNVPRGTSG